MRPLRILNVAEKNDAAKELSRIMSRGQCLRVGRAKYKLLWVWLKPLNFDTLLLNKRLCNHQCFLVYQTVLWQQHQ